MPHRTASSAWHGMAWHGWQGKALHSCARAVIFQADAAQHCLEEAQCAREESDRCCRRRVAGWSSEDAALCMI
jgi:hypothetical protein